MICLEKLNENGKKIFWSACFAGNIVITTFGQINGKIQEKSETFTEGKNIGKKNETTPEEQCILETVKKARKKIDNGYSVKDGEYYLDKYTFKTTVKTNLDIPKPMLAQTINDHWKKLEKIEEILIQPKIDGNRVLVNTKTGEMYSRSRKKIISCPHIGKEVIEIFSNIDVEWLDGELYSDKLTFNEIQSFIRKSKNINYKKSATNIRMHIFDYISDENQFERQHRLTSVFNTITPTYLHKVLTYKIKSDKKIIDDYHNAFLQLGYEGVIIRIPDFSYEQKRSYSLFKYKNFYDEEFEVIGFKPQRNNLSILGSVVCKTKFGHVFNAKPIGTKKERDEIWNNQFAYLGQMATIKYQEKDEKTDIPRFPVLKSFRDK